MKITYKGDYALKTILELALHYDQDVVTSHELAARIDAPVKFLEQVLMDLKKGGFVKSRRGKVGGYLLSRAPGKIALGEVVRLIDGPVEPISCVREEYSECADVTQCVFRGIWRDVARATSNIVDNITFEDLVTRVHNRQQALTYSI